MTAPILGPDPVRCSRIFLRAGMKPTPLQGNINTDFVHHGPMCSYIGVLIMQWGQDAPKGTTSNIQEAHWPHRSPEKTVQINKHI